VFLKIRIAQLVGLAAPKLAELEVLERARCFLHRSAISGVAERPRRPFYKGEAVASENVRLPRNTTVARQLDRKSPAGRAVFGKLMIFSHVLFC